MDGISELAVLLKERENKHYLGPQVGEVISPPPNIKVKLGASITLTKEDLVIAAHLLNGYIRQFTIPSTTATGSTNSADAHSHSITQIGIANGEITLTDTLKVGDEVILIPSTDDQTYYLIDRVVRL